MIPAFSVKSTQGTVTENHLRGKKTVLYFYPKDNTPGCTLEGQDFTRLKKSFANIGAQIFGVSRDSVKSHMGFKEKQCFTFDLLSDSEEILCGIFDVIKEKNMYGKKVWGVERSTFVIDEKGQLLKEYRGVKAQGHAEQVLKDLQG
ncbi:MAG: peroxiredoxin [Pseudobdellovibrionaceae bacterium]